MKIVETPNDIFIYRVGLHNKSSHVDDRSIFLKVSQQQVVRNAVRLSPLVPGSAVRRNLNNLSPNERVDPKYKECVKQLVRKELKTVLSKELDGVKMDGNYGIVAPDCGTWQSDLVCRQNLGSQQRLTP